VYTGPEVSVTLAVTYRTHGSDIWTDAHKFNAKLRGIGWRPRPVGSNPTLDRWKSATMGLTRHARSVLWSARPEPT
jgi:hypothetical protein